MNKIELLAPAGDLERAKIAILYGADAVYVGGKKFSLRARASNFEMDDIYELCRFAKEHDALELKAGIVEGKVAGLEDLKRYAAIPSRDTLLTMLAAGLLGTVRDLSICLDLYSKEKENN